MLGIGTRTGRFSKANKRMISFSSQPCVRGMHPASYSMCKRNGKTIPVQAWTGPEGSGFRAPNFRDNGYIKVVKLSTLSIGRLYRLAIILGSHFC